MPETICKFLLIPESQSGSMSKLKRKAQPKEIEPQKYQAGETVALLRPHLWSNYVGVVVSFKEGLYRVRIESKTDGSTCPHFHTDAKASELEGWI